MHFFVVDRYLGSEGQLMQQEVNPSRVGLAGCARELQVDSRDRAKCEGWQWEVGIGGRSAERFVVGSVEETPR